MKWIKFRDMKPPIGMNIVVTNNRGEIGIIKWEKEYLEHDSEFIDMVYNEGHNPREIYDLEYWAPVEFLYEVLPPYNHDYGDALPVEQDWHLQHKDNPHLIRMKEIIQELATNTDEVNDKWEQRGAVSTAYKRHLLYEIGECLTDIAWPTRKEDESKARAWRDENVEFNLALLSVPVPNLIHSIPKTIMPKAGGTTLRLKPYNMPPPKYYKHKVTGKLYPEWTEISIREAQNYELVEQESP
jgi:hypothetical protein